MLSSLEIQAIHFVAAGVLAVPNAYWIAFCAGMVTLLVLDMFVFHRHAHEPTLRESALWTVFWCSLALAFNGWVWWRFGHVAGVAFFTGYLVEWSLSMDNVFVFVVIFAYFGVPLKYQYRVLFWGILGAIVMRLTFILVFGELLKRYEWIFYIFGAFLIYTGIKLARAHGVETHPDQNIVLRLARRYLRVAESSHGDRFVVRQDGRLFFTCCWWWKARTSSSRSTACRPSSASPRSRSSCLPRTSSRSWACGHCISCWPG
jgi:tellurite resistance protein TerC